MPLIKWTPFLEPWEDMDRFFEDFTPTVWRGITGFVPTVDIWQDKDNVYAEVPLPGIDPTKVNVLVENDVLTIEGKSEKKTEVEEKDYYRKEIRYGAFHRAVALPTAVAGDKSKATYENGVLKLVIPKEVRAKPKAVKVEVKSSKKKK